MSISARYFKPVVIVYGLVHIIAGVSIWLFPSVTGKFLLAALTPDAGTLVGFMSALAGLGFCGAALVESQSARQMVLILVGAGNVLNLLAHLHNISRGYSPPWFGGVAGVSILVILIILVLLYRGLDSDTHAA